MDKDAELLELTNANAELRAALYDLQHGITGTLRRDEISRMWTYRLNLLAESVRQDRLLPELLKRVELLPDELGVKPTAAEEMLHRRLGVLND